MLNVLITGAAGLIGGEVAARLTARGHRVTAMVRKNPHVRGNDGAEVAIAQVVAGDVTQASMGLDPAAHAIDCVIHCAALLEFDAPQAALDAVNVAGTKNALDFARAAGADFLHVSTAYVCGTREGSIEEAPVAGGTTFTNRYEASKATAERLVEQSGLPFAIARPSIVLGDSENGAIRDFPSLCNVFRLMARGKVGTFPARAASTLDLVPIDHVAEGIVRIAERMEQAAGGHYHLVAADPLPAAELAYGVARVPHFPDPQVIDPADYDPTQLRAAERMLLERMLGTFGAYFTRDPRFDDSRFRALTGQACPATDRAWLDRLIAYGMTRGYLPAPPALTEYRDSGAPAAPALQTPT